MEKKLVPWRRVWHDPYCLNECEGGKKPPTLYGEEHFLFGKKRHKISENMKGKIIIDTVQLVIGLGNLDLN